jgi:hypothetical protein
MQGSFRVVHGHRSAYGVNVFCSVLALNAAFSVLSVQSIVSLCSINACFSIFSMNSFMAVGCINGAFEICIAEPHVYWVMAAALLTGYVGTPRHARWMFDACGARLCPHVPADTRDALGRVPCRLFAVMWLVRATSKLDKHGNLVRSTGVDGNLIV